MIIERRTRGRTGWKTGRTRLLVLVLAVVAAALVVSRLTCSRSAPRPPAHDAVTVPIEPMEMTAAEEALPPVPEEPRFETLEAKVRPKESVSSILSRHLSSREIHDLAEHSRSVFPLHRVKAGNLYRIHLLDGEFHGFEYEIDRDSKLVFRREPAGMAVFTEPIDYEVVVETVAGTVQSSLFMAVNAAGEGAELALRLTNIFAWDVDFMLEVRSGDSFQAVVEKRYRNGEFAGYGRVLAAEFVNQGKVHRGFLFEGDSGRQEYYDAQGRNLRRAFLKAPVEYTRIASGFSHSRLHPILHVHRPHLGVDYAAPVGTPVRTIGDGVVTVRAYDRAAGNHVRIRHSSVYETSYLHLSRFARGIQQGTRVKQGQVIGYVGSTGLATGPHLCFRVIKNGRHVNPRTLKAPDVAPLPAEHMEAFRRKMEPLVARLDGGTALARAGDGVPQAGGSDLPLEVGVH